MARDMGGMDVDGDVYDASWYCEGCGVSYSWPVTPGLAPIEDPKQTEMLAIIAEHDSEGCPGLPAVPAPFVDLPRDLYFKAEDHARKNPGIREKELAIIQNQRFAQVRRASALLEDLGYALKALKAFDRTGNVGDALGHLQETALDFQKVIRNLVTDVEEAEDRHRQASVKAYREDSSPTNSAAVVEPPPTVPAAVDLTPKPGPHLTNVHVFDPQGSARAQLAAFDRATASHKQASA
jgi:hypothetical protein